MKGWFIRLSEHEKKMSEVRDDLQTKYETEILSIITEGEKRRANMEFQNTLLKDSASLNVTINEKLVRKLEERHTHIRALQAHVEKLEQYISEQDTITVLK